MAQGPFRIAQLRPIRDAMTVSRSAGLATENSITYFSLGADTSISRESYDRPAIYVGAEGTAVFRIGEPYRDVPLYPGRAVIVPAKTLCGVMSPEGCVYTEIILKEEIVMNNLVKAGEAFQLKDLISYEEGSIANLDITHNGTMKYVLMAFDEGTGLTPHRAPGDAIVFALEGKAVIGYEGVDYPISAGECFRFEKNGLHSVTADGRFKMALLLVLQ